MGNWRNRPPRRFYHQDRAPRSSYHTEPPPIPSHGFCDDGVPLWEKKFCALIGSIQWRKVVDAKNFMYCHGNVVNWDDSAGEEAFQNAKKRFWAEINGLPCDISLPDPDIYIDEINWKPDIDPKLIKELEQAYFAPDDGEKEGKSRRRNKKTRNFVSAPSDWCNKNPDNGDNPWECNNNIQGTSTLKVKPQGWNQWDNNVNNSRNSNNDDNPWERSITQGNESVKNTWGDCGDQLWGGNQWGSNTDQLRDWDNGDNHWGHSCQGVGSVKNKGWGGGFGDNSWGWNQHDSRKLYNGDSSWGHSFVQDRGAPKDRGWRDSKGNTWGWKQQESYNNEPKDLAFRKNSGGWGTWNKGWQKREGSHQYVTGNKNSRFQGDDYQTSHCWTGSNAKKRVSFALE